MNNVVLRIIPFIFLGVLIVILIAGLILISYALILGAIVGLILFVVTWLKEKLFSPKKKSISKRRSNRTIDHDQL